MSCTWTGPQRVEATVPVTVLAEDPLEPDESEVPDEPDESEVPDESDEPDEPDESEVLDEPAESVDPLRSALATTGAWIEVDAAVVPEVEVL
ncbi:MAG: hypothetical protein ACJ72D_20400 [Marmoricola sp.]